MKPGIVDFEHTENAFAYKSDRELKKAERLFALMRSPLAIKLGTAIVPWAIRTGLPVRGAIRHTIFKQFVGGETMEETGATAATLGRFNVQSILDYGVEGKEDEARFDEACEIFMRAVRFASSRPEIPFISMKITGMARFALLEKLDAAASPESVYAGHCPTEILTPAEQEEWERVVRRMTRITALADEKRVGVLVDAEESWIQAPIDALTMRMMEKYNRDRAVVYNTVQLYRKGRLSFLENCFKVACGKGFVLGIKLVRGAYMEKERARAKTLHIPSPIQDDKAACDRDYDEALAFAISHVREMAIIIATHNEQSIDYAIRRMIASGLPVDYPHIHFSQLFGMGDNISFNLAKAGYLVSKYLPFGAVSDVIPYLMRRAEENSSVAGQTRRALTLIRKEIRRRRASRLSVQP